MPDATITVSKVSEIEKDKSILKIVILAVFGIAITALSVFFFGNFLMKLNPGDLIFWFVFSLFSISLLILQASFVKSAFWLKCIAFLHGIVPLFVFWKNIYPNPSIPLITGSVVFGLLLASAASKGRKIAMNGFSLKVSLVARNTIPRAVSALLIFLSIITYVSYFEKGSFTDPIGKSIVSGAVVAADPIFQVWFPGVSLNQNAGDFLEGIAENRLKDMPIDLVKNDGTAYSVFLRNLTDQMKSKLISESASQLGGVVQGITGPFSPSDKVENVLYQAIKKAIGGVIESTGPLFGIIAAVSVFLTLKGFFFLFHWLIAFIAFLLFKLLLLTGFAYFGVEEKTREFVMLS